MLWTANSYRILATCHRLPGAYFRPTQKSEDRSLADRPPKISGDTYTFASFDLVLQNSHRKPCKTRRLGGKHGVWLVGKEIENKKQGNVK